MSCVPAITHSWVPLIRQTLGGNEHVELNQEKAHGGTL